MSLITCQPAEESLATQKCAISLSAEKARMCTWVCQPASRHLARNWKQASSVLYTPHIKTLWKTVAFGEIAKKMSSRRVQKNNSVLQSTRRCQGPQGKSRDNGARKIRNGRWELTSDERANGRNGITFFFHKFNLSCFFSIYYYLLNCLLT